MKPTMQLLFLLVCTSFSQDVGTGLLSTPMSDDEWNSLQEFSPSAIGTPVAARATLYASKGDIRQIIGATNIKDQGACNSCLTNSIITQAEYALRRHFVYNLQLPQSSTSFDLSVNQVLSCLNLGCDGQTWDNVSNKLYSDQTKLVLNTTGTETQSKSQVASHGCTLNNSAYAYFNTNQGIPFQKISSQGAVKDAILRGMAVGVDIRVKEETDFNFGCNNVTATKITSNAPNHAVVIIGYDDNLDGGAWLVQNSWGNCNGNGIRKVKYGALNMQHYRALTSISYTSDFLTQVKPSWCYNASGKYSQVANGYLSSSVVASNQMRVVFSSGFTTPSGLVAPPIPMGNYITTVYKVSRVVEVPLGATIENDPNSTYGTGFSSADSWSNMVLSSEIIDGINRNFATFSTYVYKLVNVSGQTVFDYWPTNPSSVQFRYFVSGNGICSNTTSAPIVQASTKQLDVIAGAAIAFSAENTGGFAESWYWQFGDNTTSNVQYPSHVYTKAGIYQVAVQGANRYGVSNSNTLTIRVKPNMVPVLMNLLD